MCRRTGGAIPTGAICGADLGKSDSRSSFSEALVMLSVSFLMKIFVTVGTTQFEDLVGAVLKEDFQLKLCELGFRQMIVQHGSSRF